MVYENHCECSTIQVIEIYKPDDTWSGGLVGTLETSIMFVFVTSGLVSAGWECLGTINFVQLLNILSLLFTIQYDVL